MSQEILARELAHNSFIKARPEDSVSSLIGRFLKEKQNQALVFDETGSYQGVTSKEQLLKKHVDFSELKTASIVKNKPVLYGDDSLSTIAELMFSTDARVLPVFEKKRFLGVVTARDVVFCIRNDHNVSNRSVQDVASSKVITVSEDASLEQAISLLRDQKIGRIPLVSKTGELSGLFSFSDLLSNVAFHEHKRPRGRQAYQKESPETTKVLQSPVKMAASRFPITIRPNDSLQAVLDRLQRQNVSCLVVVEQKKPVGILTVRDLLSVLIKPVQSAVRIEFVNKPQLDEVDEAALQKKARDFCDKCLRRFQAKAVLSVRFKLEQAKGIRKKYTVSVHANAPGFFKMATGTDWGPLPAAFSAFKSFARELQKSKR